MAIAWRRSLTSSLSPVQNLRAARPKGTTDLTTLLQSGLELRLGAVTAAGYIGERFVFRESPYEVQFVDDERWTEKPESYVRRALARTLFTRRGVRQIVYGGGTTIDVDVVAFDEVRAPKHVARVEIVYRLSDDRVVRFTRSITVERAIEPATGAAAADAVVAALARALSDSVDRVADQTIAELRVERLAEGDAAAVTP